MNNNLLIFIDNIQKAIDLQEEHLFEEAKNNNCIIGKDDNGQFIQIGDIMKIYTRGKAITINDTDSSEPIDRYIRSDIIPLFDKFDYIHFAVDCHLDAEDEKNTSYIFINSLVNLDDSLKERLIISVVSGYYHTKVPKTNIINMLNPEIKDKVKVLTRPLTNKIDEYYWDSTESANGRYDLGELLFTKHKDDRSYKPIEDLLYNNFSSAIYFGILLLRFIKDDEIEEMI